MPIKQRPNLTSGRLLAGNSIWNLLGQILPMAVGLFSVPFILRGIGVERFGILSLAWIVVGYFSLFDLGIGRALTKLVADKLGAGEENAIPPLAWTSLLLLFSFGAFGALVTILFSSRLVHGLLKIPIDLQTEALHGFYVLAASIPVVTVTAGLRGILEALQRFRLANLIRIPMSVFSFVGPLLVLPFSHALIWVIGVLVIGRVIGCIIHVVACLQVMPALRHDFVVHLSLVWPALKLGTWMTVSNIVGPLMMYLDRFLIGSLLSVSAVAYYTAPFDLTSRLLAVPAAISAVLFPAFAASLAQNVGETRSIFTRGVKYIFLIVFPIVLVIAAFAPEGLRVWLGGTFSEHGAIVLRWLAMGTLLNCLAFVPFAMVQGAGRPDLTAKLHLVELPGYFLALYLLVRSYGIEGAAIAWTARVAVDAFLLFFFANRLLLHNLQYLLKLTLCTSAALLALFVPTLVPGFVTRTLIISSCLIALVIIVWFRALTPREKTFLTRPWLASPVSGSPAPMPPPSVKPTQAEIS
jgi:O-antigen/teichoic acid export membrane protein